MRLAVAPGANGSFLLLSRPVPPARGPALGDPGTGIGIMQGPVHRTAEAGKVYLARMRIAMLAEAAAPAE